MRISRKPHSIHRKTNRLSVVCCVVQDNVPSEIAEILQTSGDEFISGLISESAHASSAKFGKAKKKTVLSKFKVRVVSGESFTT